MKSYISQRSRKSFINEKFGTYFEFVFLWLLLSSLILVNKIMAIVGLGAMLYVYIIHRKNEYIDVKVKK